MSNSLSFIIFIFSLFLSNYINCDFGVSTQHLSGEDFLECIFQLFYIYIKINLCVTLTYMFSLFLDLFLENLFPRVKWII